MSESTNTTLPPIPGLAGNHALNLTESSLFFLRYVFQVLLSNITIWRVFVLLLVLGNIKNVPLIWHVSIPAESEEASSDLFVSFQLRIVNAFRFCCKTQRPKDPITSAHLFQPLITTSHAPIMEIDFNFHSKSIHCKYTSTTSRSFTAK